MVTVQTEHLEDHSARLTVDVPTERIEKAMRQTARQIAKKAKIPGFRPGKAPFNIIVNMFGFDYVLSESLEQIGNDIYREALEASEVEPYAPGSLTDVEEQGKKLVFVVPKRPTIDLGDYRSVRVEYEEPEVTDAMVEEAMENLRDQQAVVEDVDRPAKMGDQVRIEHFYVAALLTDEEIAEQEAAEAREEADSLMEEDLEAVDDALAEDEAPQAEAEAAETDAEAATDESEAEADDETAADAPEREIFHQHDWTRVLDASDRDLFPGFSEELVGAVAGDELEFYLDLPEDYEEEDLAGKRLRIEAVIEQVQSRMVPDWSDELAKTISEDEFETILELRMNVREQLAEQAKQQNDRAIAEEALDHVVEGAELHYPDEVVDDYLDDIIRDLEQNVLSQQGLKLEHFLTMTGQSEEEFREGYRESAVRRAERSLALGELVRQEELAADESDIDQRIEAMIESMGGEERAGQFRQFFGSEQSRYNISNQVATDRAMERLVAIAKGENPPVGVQRDETDETADTEDATAAAAVAAGADAEAAVDTLTTDDAEPAATDAGVTANDDESEQSE